MWIRGGSLGGCGLLSGGVKLNRFVSSRVSRGNAAARMKNAGVAAARSGLPQRRLRLPAGHALGDKFKEDRGLRQKAPEMSGVYLRCVSDGRRQKNLTTPSDL